MARGPSKASKTVAKAVIARKEAVREKKARAAIGAMTLNRPIGKNEPTKSQTKKRVERLNKEIKQIKKSTGPRKLKKK